jgi:hypothetical protein
MDSVAGNRSCGPERMGGPLNQRQIMELRMVSKTIILNKLHKVLVNTQKLEPVATNRRSVILSQTQIEERLLLKLWSDT